MLNILNIAVFAYNRESGLTTIIEECIKSSMYLKRLMVVSNGVCISESQRNRIPSSIELIVIQKRGCFDSSLLIFYDIASHWDGYTFLCGDDDLPNLRGLHEAMDSINKGPSSQVPLIVFSPPTVQSPALCDITNQQELAEELRKLAFRLLPYRDLLLNFIFSLPLGSFLIRSDMIKSCPRSLITDNIGTWHAYSALAFNMVKSNHFVFLPNVQPLVPQALNYPKTYKLDKEMMKSLYKWFDLLDYSILSDQERSKFMEQSLSVVESWIVD